MSRFALIALVVSLLGSPRPAGAEGAFVGFFGASTGASFAALGDQDVNLETAIRDSPIFGARIGGYGFPFGFEGSLTYSPATLEGGVFDGAVEGATNILYTEANALLIVLPGPIAPFVTAGVGVHYLDFDIADLASFSKTRFGYNYGGGLKARISALALRFDVRNHVTTFGLEDFGVGLLGNLVGLGDTDTRIQNVEISFGVGVSF